MGGGHSIEREQHVQRLSRHNYAILLQKWEFTRQSLMPTVIQSGSTGHYACVQHFVLEMKNKEFNKM